MKRLLFGMTLMVLSTSFVNCEKEDASVSGDPEVLFEVSYTNHAWGKVHEGFLVDRDGKIHTYKNPQQWNVAEPGKPLSAEQVRYNLEQTQISGKTIPLNVLQANAEKITSVNTDQYSKRINKGNDNGSTVYYLYRYDAAQKAYRSVLLKETGDWETQNTDTNAKEIATWLTSVEESL